MTNPNEQERRTFTAWLRQVFGGVLNTVAGFLNSLGVKPNVVTILGWVGNFAAGALVGLGELTWGGFLVLMMAPLDALDGALARLRGEDGEYGAFIDSATDRYSEIALYGGLLFYYLQLDSTLNIVLVFLAITGSIMVSYMRARAESLNFSAKIGLMSRVERYIVLIPGLLFRRPDISLWVLAILTHFTALQRFLYVRSQARTRMAEPSNQKE